MTPRTRTYGRSKTACKWCGHMIADNEDDFEYAARERTPEEARWCDTELPAAWLPGVCLKCERQHMWIAAQMPNPSSALDKANILMESYAKERRISAQAGL